MSLIIKRETLLWARKIRKFGISISERTRHIEAKDDDREVEGIVAQDNTEILIDSSRTALK